MTGDMMTPTIPMRCGGDANADADLHNPPPILLIIERIVLMSAFILFLLFNRAVIPLIGCILGLQGMVVASRQSAIVLDDLVSLEEEKVRAPSIFLFA